MDTTTNVTSWIRAGFVGLLLYGLLTLWASLDPQPDPAKEYEAWARFVTADKYAITHVLGSGLGVILAIMGTFALGVALAWSRVGRLGLWSMVIAVFGQSMFLFFAGVSAFGSPMEGQAYLAGMNLDELPATTADSLQTLVLLTGIVLSFVGNVLLGVAIWRSALLPKWVGMLWAFAALLMYPFGIILGALTTGATPVTVPIGAALIAVSGAWMAWETTQEPWTRRDRLPEFSQSAGGRG